jgi:hypothetical protein
MEVLRDAVVPTVMISASGLILLSFNNRLVSVLVRQRSLHRELLTDSQQHLLKRVESHQHMPFISTLVSHSVPNMSDLVNNQIFKNEKWIKSIQLQLKQIGREATMIKFAVVFMLLSVLLMLLCGSFIALSHLVPGVDILSIVVFVAGIICFFVAICIMLYETYNMMNPVHVEEEYLQEIVDYNEHVKILPV